MDSGVSVKRRGQVHWTAKTGPGKPQERPPERPQPALPYPAERLVVGAMFTVATTQTAYAPEGGLYLMPGTTTAKTPPLLTRGYFGTPTIGAGAMLVYSGIIRAEQKNGDRTISVPRHTFIHGSGRYIINLYDVVPVD